MYIDLIFLGEGFAYLSGSDHVNLLSAPQYVPFNIIKRSDSGSLKRPNVFLLLIDLILSI